MQNARPMEFSDPELDEIARVLHASMELHDPGGEPVWEKLPADDKRFFTAVAGDITRDILDRLKTKVSAELARRHNEAANRVKKKQRRKRR